MGSPMFFALVYFEQCLILFRHLKTELVLDMLNLENN